MIFAGIYCFDEEPIDRNDLKKMISPGDGNRNFFQSKKFGIVTTGKESFKRMDDLIYGFSGLMFEKNFNNPVKNDGFFSFFSWNDK
ncbi:MAG: hypothetical protein ABEK36_01450, partial [Candidatus Aenigmatarchaeota archaeon]